MCGAGRSVTQHSDRPVECVCLLPLHQTPGVSEGRQSGGCCTAREDNGVLAPGKCPSFQECIVPPIFLFLQGERCSPPGSALTITNRLPLLPVYLQLESLLSLCPEMPCASYGFVPLSIVAAFWV